MMAPAEVYTRHGKQVLECGQHFCDARDERAADLIARGLNALRDFGAATLEPGVLDLDPGLMPDG
jgi:hypothetical protein